MIWAELRTVSGTVPEKELEAMLPSEHTGKLQFEKPAEASGGEGWESTSTITAPDEKGWVKVWVCLTALRKQGLCVLCRSFH